MAQRNGKKSDPKEKWTPDQAIHLLEVYAGEEPLYKTTSPDYHNRRVRKECMDRVLRSVREVRPETTVDQINRKIHSLRNGFNTERKKVESTKTSGAGTANVHTPSLYYYDKALFFAEYFVSRKTHSTKIGGISEEEYLNDSQSTIKDSQSTSLNSTVVGTGDTEERPGSAGGARLRSEHDYYLPGPSSPARPSGIAVRSNTGAMEVDDIEPTQASQSLLCGQIFEDDNSQFPTFDENSQVIIVDDSQATHFTQATNFRASQAKNFPDSQATNFPNSQTLNVANSDSDNPDVPNFRPSAINRNLPSQSASSGDESSSTFRVPVSPASSTVSRRRRKRDHSPTNAYEKLLLDTLKEKPIEPLKGDTIGAFLDFVGGVLRKLPSREQDDIMQSVFAQVMTAKARLNVPL